MSISDFSYRLKAFMRVKSLINKDLAKIVKTDSTQVGRWLSGSIPKIDKLQKLKDEYPDLNLNWLLNGEGQMSTSETEEELKRLKKALQETDKAILYETIENAKKELVGIAENLGKLKKA